MRRALLILMALVATVLVATSGATADSAFTDPAGDGKGGPDVTAVAVTNDAAGVVTMKITTTQQGGSSLIVFIDTDLNGKVDDAAGKAIGVLIPTPGVAVPMAFGFDGSGNLVPTQIPSLRATATATEIQLVFAKTDIGVNQGFAFWLFGMTPTDDDGDEAPDSGMWTYILTVPPPPPPPPVEPVAVKPVIGAPIATMAVAGKPMTVTFPVTRSDNGAPLLKGTMTCDPSVSGKALAHRESFTAGKAKLVFTVPKAAKGKLLKVKLTISSSGFATTKIATFKVR